MPTLLTHRAPLLEEWLEPVTNLSDYYLSGARAFAENHGLELGFMLVSIGVATLVCLRDGKETIETRYYISSLPVEPDAKAFAHAVRSHWGVENGCHWTLDVSFREDESRIREKRLRENMAWLNRFSLSLLKQHPGRQSVAMKRRSCGWSDDFLMQVVIGSVC